MLGDCRLLRGLGRPVTDVSELEGGLFAATVELWVPGSAVVALGAGDDGAEALAVWQVSPQGALTGAWLVPTVEAFTVKETARRLLTLIERRGITGMTPDDVEHAVSRLTAAGGIGEERWWERQVFSPVQGFREILARRQEIDMVIEAARQTRKNVAALEWTHDFPDDVAPQSVEDLRQLATIGAESGTLAGGAAVTVGQVLRWLVRVWAETEQVKNRRGYVREVLGEREALPPAWLAAVQTASATVLPL